MVDLHPHHQSCNKCSNRNRILEGYKPFTEYHFSLAAESAAHHIDRLGCRNQQSRQ